MYGAGNQFVTGETMKDHANEFTRSVVCCYDLNATQRVTLSLIRPRSLKKLHRICTYLCMPACLQSTKNQAGSCAAGGTANPGQVTGEPQGPRWEIFLALAYLYRHPLLLPACHSICHVTQLPAFGFNQTCGTIHAHMLGVVTSVPAHAPAFICTSMARIL